MKTQTIRVLMVDDNEDDYLIVRRMLTGIKTQTFFVEWASNYQKALEYVPKHDHGVYLVDYRLGGESGLDFLQAANDAGCTVPIILLTGMGDYQIDLEAMKFGAADFLNKNKLEPDLLERTIRYALEREEARKKLQAQAAQLASILGNMAEGVAMMDPTGKFVYFNQAAEKILGSGPSQKAHDHWVAEYGLYLPNSETYFPTEELPFVKAVRGEEADNVEILVLNHFKPQGTLISVTARPLKDENGRFSGGVAVFRDVTDLKKAEEQIRRHAFYSFLTGLPNRALFLDRVGQALQRLKRDPANSFTVLFLNLGGLKKINDTFGHAVGDRILKESGKRLEGLVNGGDTAAHLGGNEFAVLLGGTAGREESGPFVEKLQKAFERPFEAEQQEIFLHTAMGLVVNPLSYDRPEDVVRDAHVAMYWARTRTKTGFEVFNPSMRAGTLEKLQMETDLRRALERAEFQLHYQPIVSLETGVLTGFEALLRWNHPQKGMVSPADFIPLAEESGLIVPIGEWVLKEACRQMRVWLDRFPGRADFSVSVNLSAKQFVEKNLVVNILRFLADKRLSPRHLNLEITESVMMENFDAAYIILHQLKKSHLRLHLDDFGTGYSSLSHLHRFPLDLLKIDQSFVRRMTAGGKSEIVSTIIALAYELGMGMIAEGIETAEQFQMLKNLKCKEGQGYFFAKPMEAQMAGELLAGERRWELKSSQEANP